MKINTISIKKYFSDKTNIIIFSLLVLVTIFGAIVRFKNIGVLAYWGDDGQTVLGTLGILKYGFPKLSSGNIMYHTLFSFYLRAIPSYIFGLNEVALRFPSAFFGVLTIPLIFLFLKDAVNKYTGILAAIIVSLNAWQIEFSRETRYYSEFQFFYLLSIYLFYRGYIKEENKFKIPTIICILATTLIHNLGFTLIFLFVPLLIYKRFKGFFKKEIIISFFVVLLIILGGMIHRELFWKAGLSFYQINVTSDISNPILKILSKYFFSYIPFYHRIFEVLFPHMYYIVFYGWILIVIYLFIPQIRSNKEDFMNIYSSKKLSIKLPFNLFFLYFLFFSNTVFNGLGYQSTQQRYIYHIHPIFIAIFCYIIFDVSRLISLGIVTIYNKIKENRAKYSFYLKNLSYFTVAAIIFILTISWINPVTNFKIVNRKNGDSINSLFAVSSTFSFHHDPKTPGQYIYNHKQEGDIVIATDLLNPYGYTKQIDYWLWTCTTFNTWQPFIYKDGKVYDEFFRVPIIRDIYQLYSVLNKNANKNIWLITSNSIRVPEHISPDVAEFINSQKWYKVVTGKDGICSAYLFPKTDGGQKRFFFIPDKENIINIPESRQPYIINFTDTSNQPYLKYGWSHIESQGTWADKNYSILFLNFAQRKDYIIKLTVMPLYSAEKEQEMKILFNNQEIGKINFTNFEFGQYSFTINKELVKTSEYNTLEFNYKYLLCPQELGISPDSRNLSVYFNRIIISNQY